jgi:F1F0 ATPase subunit 2
MSEGLTLLAALAGGGVLGAIFFGGLWWTVRKGVLSSRPALWFLGSMLARTAIALGGIYLLAGHDWKRLLLCLCGFLTGRMGVTLLVRRPLVRRPAPGGSGCNLLPIR